VEPEKRKVRDSSHARSVNDVAWPAGGLCCPTSLLITRSQAYESFYLFFGWGAGRTYTEIAEGGEQFDRRSVAAELVPIR
jgi:hypothetical protein